MSGRQVVGGVEDGDAVVFFNFRDRTGQPSDLLLGRGALRGARRKIKDLQADIDAWEATTVGADFPEPDA